MTQILPFKAIRPTRDKAHLVATMPYYVYKKNVLEAKLEHNPYTFLHVIHPDYPQEMNLTTNPADRFHKSRKKFEEFIQEGVFVQDARPCLYLYRQTKDGHEYLGIIGGASVHQYLNGHIKKHEAILPGRVHTFKNYLDALKYNAEPVLLFHQKHDQLNALLEAIAQHRPEYEFTSTERIKHEVWVIENTEAIAQIQNYYREINDVYIADGHHRCASSAEYVTSSSSALSAEEEHFMAYFISEEKLFIQEYNRVIKELGDLTTEEFLEKLKIQFAVEQLESFQSPSQIHSFSMYVDGQWYALKLKQEFLPESDAVKLLDTSLLSDLILDPLLKIKDISHDTRIDFISGNRGESALTRLIDSGEYAVGFILYPIEVNQLKRIADENKIMPPKSTWIEPKLRSGLTIYPLN